MNMNDVIDQNINNYFKIRTPNRCGIVKDISARPNMNSESINVGDNDYLNVENLVDIENSDQVFSSVFSIDGAQNQACLITQPGYSSNTGAMHDICDRDTRLYIDRCSSSSFRNGTTLKKAKIHAFKHNDMDELESLIQKFGQGFIMVEGLYIIDGGLLPIDKSIELKKKHVCTLLVDESRSFRIYDKQGMGFSSTTDEYDEVDIFTVSLAKTLGSRAGIVASSQKTIDFI